MVDSKDLASKSAADPSSCCILGSASSVESNAPSAMAYAQNGRLENNNNGTVTIKSFGRERVDITFQDINYKVLDWNIKKIVPDYKKILHGVSGVFRSGELTAVMGPSGAGKSSLLNILAGYVSRGASGSVMFNDIDILKNRSQKYLKLSSYIQQDEKLRAQLTVLESMMILSHLRFGVKISMEKKHFQIKTLLQRLGLDGCEKILCGKLSGGQRKRLSLALELISNPPIILLDEPTTGLDSSSCYQCIELLKSLAEDGHTIVCTIHQPSAKLFELFDHIYAVSAGECVYQGSTSSLVPFLANHGMVCPKYHNPADFLIEVASGEYETDLSPLIKSAVNRIDDFKDLSKEIDNSGNKVDLKEDLNQQQPLTKKLSVCDVVLSKPSPAPTWLQFFILFKRNMIIFKRNYNVFFIRLFAHIGVALIFGYLYYNCAPNAHTVFANAIFIYGSILFLMYTGLMPALLWIPLEFQIVSAEHFNRWYSLASYSVATVLVEIPQQVFYCLAYLSISYYLTGQRMELEFLSLQYFVCSLSSITSQGLGFFFGATMDVRMAVFAAPIVTVLLSVFGLTLIYRDCPFYFKWLFNISYFRAAFQIAMYGQYNTVKQLICPDDMYCHFKPPKKIMNEFDFSDVNTRADILLITASSTTLFLATVIVVWFKLNKR